MSNELDNSTLSETDIQSAVELKPSGPANVIMDSQILTALMECPRKTDFRFNLNLVSVKGKSNSIECGSILHKYLEVYYLCIIKGMPKQEAHKYGLTAAEMYIRSCPDCTDFHPTDEVPKPVCGHKPDDYPGVRNTPAQSEENKTGWQYVLDTCQQYYDFYRNDHWVPLEVETVKQRILYQDDEVRVLWKAKLDLVVDTNQGIFPEDHKTMKQNRPTLKLNNQFMGQCLVMGTRQMIINKVGWQKTLPAEKKFLRSPISYTAAGLTEWYSETLPFYAKLLIMYAEGGYFPPNHTSCDGKYGKCPFYDVCVSDPGMREEELRNQFMVGKKWDVLNDEPESE